MADIINTMEIKGIKKHYRKKAVLEDVSMTADAGSCIGILGGNGSGKSTLLSVLAGVREADEGQFLYEGKDLLQNRKLAEQIVGYVPQENPLMAELTARDNLRLWYDRRTLDAELSDGCLAMLGIGDFLHTPVEKMSGGMKKRLSIGCAIAHKPKILLLDEPSSALDIICKERIYNYFEEFKSQGGTLLLATHEVQELELCDRLYILKEGRLFPYQYDGNVHRLVGVL